jgi:hypothetical protein
VLLATAQQYFTARLKSEQHMGVPLPAVLVFSKQYFITDYSKKKMP